MKKASCKAGLFFVFLVLPPLPGRMPERSLVRSGGGLSLSDLILSHFLHENDKEETDKTGDISRPVRIHKGESSNNDDDPFRP